MANNRVEYIDIAKGIGIILIIIGHCNLPDSIINAIFSFHVPLFFIMSGFFIKPYNKNEIRKLLKHLLLPMYFTTLLVVLLVFLFNFNNWEYEGPDIWRILSRYIFCRHYGVFGLWFLLALFWGKLIVQLAIKFLYPICTLVLFVLLFGIGLLLPQYLSVADVPFYLIQGFSCSIFIYIGYLFHNKCDKNIFNNKVLWLIPLCLFSYKCAPVNMAAGLYPLGVFNIVLSCIFSFSIIMLAWIISKTRYKSLLVYYGENTLVILCLHGLIHSVYELIPFEGNVYAGLLEICVIGVVVLWIRKITFLTLLFCIK